MFCPNCGKDCSPTDRFCLSCGTKLYQPEQPVMNETAAQTVTPVQNSSPIPPEQPLYDPMKNGQQMQYGMPDSPSGGAYNNTYSQPSYAGAAGTLGASPRKRSGIPKFLIVAVVAVIVVAIGIGAFFFIRNKMERDFLLNNPTKYVYSAAETYFDSSNADSDFYSILKGVLDEGTIKVEISGEAKADGNSMKVSSSSQIAYDKKNRKVYYKIDGGGLMPLFVMGDPGAGGNAVVEFYADTKRMDFAYDMMGQSFSYYIEPGKFREQAENSIFSPSKDNVLGVTQEQFDSIVDGFENAYRTIMDNTDNGLEEMTDSIISKIEKDANVTVESGSAKVNGKDYNTDIVTYTFDHAAVKALMGDFRDEFIGYVKKHKDLFGGNTADAEKSITEGINQAISAFDKNANKNMKIELKVYLDSSKKELVKLEIKLDNLARVNNSQSSNHFEIIGEFSHDPEMNINIKLTDGKNDVTVSVAKTVNGDVTRYNFEGGMSASPERATASLEYNKSTKVFTFIAGDVTLSGTLEINGDTAVIGYDLPVPAEQGNAHLKIEISDKAQMNTIDAEKNFLLITKEEFEQLGQSFGGMANMGNMGNMGNMSTPLTSNNYSADAAMDAAMIDNACKTFYAGVVSGSINSDTLNPDGTPVYAAADMGASQSERKTAAENAMVYDALIYSGLDYDEDYLSSFAVDAEGNIVPLDSDVLTDYANINVLSGYITFGDIYNVMDY